MLNKPSNPKAKHWAENLDHPISVTELAERHIAETAARIMQEVAA